MRQLGFIAVIASIAGGMAFASGCTAHPRPGLAYGAVRAWNKTVGGEVQRNKSVEIPMSGVMDVEIDNFAGDVVIHSTGKSEGGTMDLVRRAASEMGQRSELEDSLSDISLTYEVVDRGDRKALVIHATTKNAKPWFQAIDIDIAVPRLGVVIVRTNRGHVMATDFEDGVDIETTKGDVRVATNTPIRLPSTVLNKEGSIDWRVPPRSAGAYQLEAINGEVQVRVRKGSWLATDKRNDNNSNFGILNKGSNLVVLRTVEGDVQVFVGDNPTEMGSFID